MRRDEEIADRFDSASEASWLANHWNLRPYTRDIKPYLMFGFVSSGFVASLAALFWLQSNQDEWINNMRSLYAPYKAAVLEIEKLEYCDSSRCVARKEKLLEQKDKAWTALCEADSSEEYVRRLMNENLPYQGCEKK